MTPLKKKKIIGELIRTVIGYDESCIISLYACYMTKLIF